VGSRGRGDALLLRCLQVSFLTGAGSCARAVQLAHEFAPFALEPAVAAPAALGLAPSLALARRLPLEGRQLLMPIWLSPESPHMAAVAAEAERFLDMRASYTHIPRPGDDWMPPACGDMLCVVTGTRGLSPDALVALVDGLERANCLAALSTDFTPPRDGS
jgi:hypothetical protein